VYICTVLYTVYIDLNAFCKLSLTSYDKSLMYISFADNDTTEVHVVNILIILVILACGKKHRGMNTILYLHWKIHRYI